MAKNLTKAALEDRNALLSVQLDEAERERDEARRLEQNQLKHNSVLQVEITKLKDRVIVADLANGALRQCFDEARRERDGAKNDLALAEECIETLSRIGNQLRQENAGLREDLQHARMQIDAKTDALKRKTAELVIMDREAFRLFSLVKSYENLHRENEVIPRGLLSTSTEAKEPGLLANIIDRFKAMREELSA